MQVLKLNHLTKIVIFIAIAILVVSISYLLADPSSRDISENYQSLSFLDMIFIFLLNTFNIMVLLAFSWLGIPMIFVITFLMGMGQTAALTNVNPIHYFGSSFLHGLLELIVIYVVLDFMFKQFHGIYSLFKKEGDTTRIKNLYIHLVKRRVPLILLLLFIASLVEVYISNNIFLYFANN